MTPPIVHNFDHQQISNIANQPIETEPPPMPPLPSFEVVVFEDNGIKIPQLTPNQPIPPPEPPIEVTVEQQTQGNNIEESSPIQVIPADPPIEVAVEPQPQENHIVVPQPPVEERPHVFVSKLT
jgi:hypothetical protein